MRDADLIFVNAWGSIRFPRVRYGEDRSVAC